MRNPVRSETDAFYIAVGCVALIAVALLLGTLVDPLVGVALFAGAVLGAFAWEVATKDPERRRPLQEAAAEALRARSSGRRAGARGREPDAARRRAAGGAAPPRRRRSGDPHRRPDPVLTRPLLRLRRRQRARRGARAALHGARMGAGGGRRRHRQGWRRERR